MAAMEATQWPPPHILRAAERIQLQEFVRSVILCPPKDESLTHSKVADRVVRSGIHIRENNDAMRACRCFMLFER
jgi:hypothetical protein